MQNNKLERIMREVGLLESEIKTYLAALRRGPSSVSDLAAYTNLTRQSIYNATSRLVSMGLMMIKDSRGGQGKAIYASENPRKLLICAEQRRREFDVMVDELESLMPDIEMYAGGEKPTVIVLEGHDGLCQAMSEIVESGSEGGFEMVDFACLQNILLPEQMEKLHSAVKNQTDRKLTGLYTRDTNPCVAQMVQRAAFLPESEDGFGSVLSVFNNKIVLVSFRGKMHTIIIEDENLAKAMKVLFGHTYEHVAETETETARAKEMELA
jgi:sugar-specific transcriptional regulator TrmB